MASVDLADLVPSLESSLSIPGSTSPYANASESEWVAKLVNGFWAAVLDQVIIGYTSDEDGMVSQVDGDETLSGELQYLIVLYASMNIIRNQLMQLKTVFRAKSGPVEYETQQSAQVLKTLLDQYMAQRDTILDNLANSAQVSTYYIDAVRARDYAIRDGISAWAGY